MEIENAAIPLERQGERRCGWCADGGAPSMAWPSFFGEVPILYGVAPYPSSGRSWPPMPARPERPARPAVLLVEDNDLLRRACTITLQQDQYVVLSASDGARALELLNDLAQRPDVLVVDMHLPDMNGADVVRRAGVSRPVLYVSADRRALAEARLVAGPGDAVLAKPFSPEALLAHIAELLGDETDPETDPEPDVA